MAIEQVGDSILDKRISRRRFLKVAAGVAAAGITGGLIGTAVARRDSGNGSEERGSGGGLSGIDNTPTSEVFPTPTITPTQTPTEAPTFTPTFEPTFTPTMEPTSIPTIEPTATMIPTPEPTATPEYRDVLPYEEVVQVELKKGINTKYYDFRFSMDKRMFDSEYARIRGCSPFAWVDGGCSPISGIYINPVYTIEQVSENMERFFMNTHKLALAYQDARFKEMSLEDFERELQAGNVSGLLNPPGGINGDEETYKGKGTVIDVLNKPIHYVLQGDEPKTQVHGFNKKASAFAIRGVNSETFVEMWSAEGCAVANERRRMFIYAGLIIDSTMVLSDYEDQASGFSIKDADKVLSMYEVNPVDQLNPIKGASGRDWQGLFIANPA